MIMLSKFLKKCFINNFKFGKTLGGTVAVIVNSGCSHIQCPANGKCAENWQGTPVGIGEDGSKKSMKIDKTITLSCIGL